MIRSTVNATTHEIKADVTKQKSGLLETVSGSTDGVEAIATVEWTLAEWIANATTNAGHTMSPLPSNIHSKLAYA